MTTYDDRPLLPPSPRLALDQPPSASREADGCKWCVGRGYYIGGDELHVCWCQQPDEVGE